MSSREKVIGVLLFVVVVVWAKTYIPRFLSPSRLAVETKAGDPQGQAVLSSGQKAGSLAIEDALDWVKVKMNKEAAVDGHNPFQKFKERPENKDLKFEDLTLAGILWEQEGPVALMNDQILKAGDTIADFRVESITQNAVVLVRGDERRTLELSVPPSL